MNIQTAPKVPEWVRRALAKRLPAKDMTANTLRGAFA